MANYQIIVVNNQLHKHAQFISEGDSVSNTTLHHVLEKVSAASKVDPSCRFYWNDVEIFIDSSNKKRFLLRVKGDGRRLSAFIAALS